MSIKPIVFIVIAVIAIVLGAGLLFGEHWVRYLLEDKIADMENLHYDSLEIDFARRSLALKGVAYQTESNRLSAVKIEAHGIEVYHWLLTRQVIIKGMEIDSALITLRSIDSRNQSFGTKFPDLKSKFALEKLEVKSSFIQLIDSSGTLKAESFFDLILEDIDAEEIVEPEQLIDHITLLRTKDLKFLTPDKLYHFGIKQMNYEIAEKLLVADSAYLACLYGKYELGHITGHEKPWIKLEIDSIRVLTDSLRKLLIEHKTTDMLLYHPDLLVFRDKRLPLNHKQRPKLLCEQLADTSYSLGLDSIILVNANIVYEEFVKEGDGPGVVSFNNLNGYISNLYSFELKNPYPPHLMVSCHLYNRSKLYTDISFAPALCQKSLVKARLEPMDLTAFNDMMKYVTFIEVEQGHTSGLELEFSYDQRRAEGKMHFIYDDLKLDFFAKENAQTGRWLNELKGFLVNTFVVKDSNTYESGNFRVGEISFEREIERSMYTYWWKSALSGIKSSTSIPSLKKKALFHK